MNIGHHEMNSNFTNSEILSLGDIILKDAKIRFNNVIFNNMKHFSDFIFMFDSINEIILENCLFENITTDTNVRIAIVI